MANIADKDERL